MAGSETLWRRDKAWSLPCPRAWAQVKVPLGAEGGVVNRISWNRVFMCPSHQAMALQPCQEPEALGFLQSSGRAWVHSHRLGPIPI